MFRDTEKNLRRLEEALLAEEIEEAYASSEDEDWEADWEEDTEDWDEELDASENPAQDFARMVYADEAFDEDAAVLADRKKQRKRKGIGGQCLLALLELAGIGGLVWWWIQWLT